MGFTTQVAFAFQDPSSVPCDLAAKSVTVWQDGIVIPPSSALKVVDIECTPHPDDASKALAVNFTVEADKPPGELVAGFVVPNTTLVYDVATSFFVLDTVEKKMVDIRTHHEPFDLRMMSKQVDCRRRISAVPFETGFGRGAPLLPGQEVWAYAMVKTRLVGVCQKKGAFGLDFDTRVLGFSIEEIEDEAIQMPPSVSSRGTGSFVDNYINGGNVPHWLMVRLNAPAVEGASENDVPTICLVDSRSLGGWVSKMTSLFLKPKN
jgi:hypothetical protein